MKRTMFLWVNFGYEQFIATLLKNVQLPVKVAGLHAKDINFKILFRSSLLN
jgi:hypothetical protein